MKLSDIRPNLTLNKMVSEEIKKANTVKESPIKKVARIKRSKPNGTEYYITKYSNGSVSASNNFSKQSDHLSTHAFNIIDGSADAASAVKDLFHNVEDSLTMAKAMNRSGYGHKNWIPVNDRVNEVKEKIKYLTLKELSPTAQKVVKAIAKKNTEGYDLYGGIFVRAGRYCLILDLDDGVYDDELTDFIFNLCKKAKIEVLMSKSSTYDFNPPIIAGGEVIDEGKMNEAPIGVHPGLKLQKMAEEIFHEWIHNQSIEKIEDLLAVMGYDVINHNDHMYIQRTSERELDEKATK